MPNEIPNTICRAGEDGSGLELDRHARDGRVRSEQSKGHCSDGTWTAKLVRQARHHAAARAGHSVPQGTPPHAPQPQRPTWWKWVVGGVAALFLLSLIPTGGGSGLLGGLIGGLLAGRVDEFTDGPDSCPDAEHRAPRRAVDACGQSRSIDDTTRRLGSTGRSSGWSFGG
ncbi:MAG: hypothetical protein R3E48_23220 [Burkholderiaceae bacterium]